METIRMARNRKYFKKQLLKSIIFLFLLRLCFSVSAQTEVTSLTLNRIKAVPGDGSDVNIQLKAGIEAKAEIYGIENSPASEVHGNITLKKDTTNIIIVSGGKCVMLLNSGAGEYHFLIRGEFLVNDSLRMVGTTQGKWDGKKEGATHTLIGKINILYYEFNSNTDNPLIFKITSAGYKYIKGKGNVKDLKSGKEYSFL
jgi:hypothetical protein